MKWRSWFGRRKPVRREPASAYVVGDTWYDPRSAEILRSTPTTPGGWRAFTTRMRQVFRPAVEGPVESRAIAVFPWNVGNPLGYQEADQERALSLVPVYAAVRLLADTVATLPIKTYRRDGDNRVPMPTLPQLFKLMDDDGSLTDWLHRCVTSLALRGNAYGLITSRDGMQFPTSIFWLNPSEVACDESNPMRPVWYWQGRRIPTEDFLHIPWFTVAGKVQGLSPIEAYAATVNIGLQAQDYSAGWFAAGGIPPGTFKNTVKQVGQNEAREISSRLTQAIRGRHPIVYGADWDYTAITIPPEQAQFIQTMKLTATQIASIYGIPPEMIGGDAGGPLTYSSPEQNTTILSSLTFRPWLVKLERKFSAILPARQYLKLNIDAIVRADLLARYQAYQIANTIGLLTIDEMRALEDRPPLSLGQTLTMTGPTDQSVDQQLPESTTPRSVGVVRPFPDGERNFNPAEPRDPPSGKWIGGGHLDKLGHDLFVDIESADSVDQVIDGMRRHKAANPDVTAEELIAAADGAIAAKYPVDRYPQVDHFYSKMLIGREAEIDAPLHGKKPANPRSIRPKRAPEASDYPAVTARQAQAMQDGMPPPWSGGQRQGLRYYTGNSAVANGVLRGWIGPPGKTAADQKKIEAALRNIEQAKAAMRPSPRSIVTYRSSNAEQFNVATLAELSNLEGHVLAERGFMSTTVNKSFHLQGKVKMEIEVPEGTPMAFVKSVSKYPYEDEVLLPPGMRYRVIAVTQGRGRATVRVRVEPS